MNIVFISHKSSIYMAGINSRQLGLPRWSYLEKDGLCLVANSIGRGVEFEEHERFRVLRQGFVENIPWEKTPYYMKAVADVRNGKPCWKCSSVPELRDRFYRELPRLYELMKMKRISDAE